MNFIISFLFLTIFSTSLYFEPVVTLTIIFSGFLLVSITSVVHVMIDLVTNREE